MIESRRLSLPSYSILEKCCHEPVFNTVQKIVLSVWPSLVSWHVPQSPSSLFDAFDVIWCCCCSLLCLPSWSHGNSFLVRILECPPRFLYSCSGNPWNICGFLSLADEPFSLFLPSFRCLSRCSVCPLNLLTSFCTSWTAFGLLNYLPFSLC